MSVCHQFLQSDDEGAVQEAGEPPADRLPPPAPEGEEGAVEAVGELVMVGGGEVLEQVVSHLAQRLFDRRYTPRNNKMSQIVISIFTKLSQSRAM